MAGIFLFFLIIAFAFNLFSKDKKYSESENRMLAQKPEFSMANLASGKYHERYGRLCNRPIFYP